MGAASLRGETSGDGDRVGLAARRGIRLQRTVSMPRRRGAQELEMPGVRVIPDGAMEQSVLRRQRGHTGREPARHAIAAGLIDVDGEPARMHVAHMATAVTPPAAPET